MAEEIKAGCADLPAARSEKNRAQKRNRGCPLRMETGQAHPHPRPEFRRQYLESLENRHCV
jgi:hypothetical protein